MYSTIEAKKKRFRQLQRKTTHIDSNTDRHASRHCIRADDKNTGLLYLIFSSLLFSRSTPLHCTLPFSSGVISFFSFSSCFLFLHVFSFFLLVPVSVLLFFRSFRSPVPLSSAICDLWSPISSLFSVCCVPPSDPPHPHPHRHPQTCDLCTCTNRLSSSFLVWVPLTAMQIPDKTTNPP